MPDNVARDPLDSLTDLQFLFVTGKGGVGKSTCAAVLGLHAARRGIRTLVVIPQTSHNTPSLFGTMLSTSIAEIAPLLSAVRISPDDAMREYCRQVLHSQTLTNALFHPRVAGGFLAGIPGLSDWALLGKSWAWTRSGTFTLPKDQSKYDLVIFDAPASGDGTKMLKVPQVIMDLSPHGRLRDDAASCYDMLRDRKRSAVVVVTLAEDFAVVETEENLGFLRGELGLPIGAIIFNRVLPPLFVTGDSEQLEGVRERVERLGPSPARSGALSALATGLRYENRRSSQQRQLARLESWGEVRLEIPEITYDLSDIGALAQLHKQIGAQATTAGDHLG